MGSVCTDHENKNNIVLNRDDGSRNIILRFECELDLHKIGKKQRKQQQQNTNKRVLGKSTLF